MGEVDERRRAAGRFEDVRPHGAEAGVGVHAGGIGEPAEAVGRRVARSHQRFGGDDGNEDLEELSARERPEAERPGPRVQIGRRRRGGAVGPARPFEGPRGAGQLDERRGASRLPEAADRRRRVDRRVGRQHHVGLDRRGARPARVARHRHQERRVVALVDDRDAAGASVGGDSRHHRFRVGTAEDRAVLADLAQQVARYPLRPGPAHRLFRVNRTGSRRQRKAQQQQRKADAPTHCPQRSLGRPALSIAATLPSTFVRRRARSVTGGLAGRGSRTAATSARSGVSAPRSAAPCARAKR